MSGQGADAPLTGDSSGDQPEGVLTCTPKVNPTVTVAPPTDVGGATVFGVGKKFSPRVRGTINRSNGQQKKPWGKTNPSIKGPMVDEVAAAAHERLKARRARMAERG